MLNIARLAGCAIIVIAGTAAAIEATTRRDWFIAACGTAIASLAGAVLAMAVAIYPGP